MEDVLIIEPDKVLAEIYQTGLQSLGVSAISVSGGQAAITVLDKRPAKLICLEIHLPEHNGFEFLYELRSYPEWNSIKIVLLTYVPEPDLKLSDQQKKQLGIVRYFYKPRVSIKELGTYIKQEVA